MSYFPSICDILCSDTTDQVYWLSLKDINSYQNDTYHGFPWWISMDGYHISFFSFNLKWQFNHGHLSLYPHEVFYWAVNWYCIAGGNWYRIAGGNWYCIAGGNWYCILGGNWYCITGGNWYCIAGENWYCIPGGNWYCIARGNWYYIASRN